MPTFLLKTEPDCYSYSDLVHDGRTAWTDVRNPGAQRWMRTVRAQDDALIYHTGAQKAIVGVSRIVTDPYEDPDNPGTTGAGEIKFSLFDIEPVMKARTPLTLATIKGDRRFADFALVTQPRLSVMPVPPDLDELLRDMSGL